ncbi:MAG: glycosyltransferase family 2 protein, partial [Bacteroidota bacterium]
MVDLSIVIVTFNSESFLRDCLTSIGSQRTSFPFRVIIVDNASVDNSIALVETNFPDVHIIYNRENKGFAVANNQGIRCSVGKA